MTETETTQNTILVVDDDPPSVRLYELLLTRQADYRMVASEDPEEIVALVLSGKIDLVIMDVSLRNSRYKGVSVDGLAITRILKINPESAIVPVLIATAHAMRGDKEMLLDESLAEDYITKPITDSTLLLNKITALLSA